MDEYDIVRIQVAATLWLALLERFFLALSVMWYVLTVSQVGAMARFE